MEWTELNFGKYRGLTLPQILFKDPDYFFWAWDKEVFQGLRRIGAEAAILQQKATTIRIPPRFASHVVIHFFSKMIVGATSSGSYLNFRLVPANEAACYDDEPHSIAHRINMATPYIHMNYDKGGCKRLVRSLKFYCFENPAVRMTRERCEAFFNDHNNFHLNGEEYLDELPQPARRAQAVPQDQPVAEATTVD